jgi:hypothetical protein
MMPSLFSTAAPSSAFQLWFIVYVYILPIMLYAAWAALSVMDLVEAGETNARPFSLLVVILLPFFGAAWYLLARARTLSKSARIATVIAGAAVWLIPLLMAVWLVGRPLGPKALS